MVALALPMAFEGRHICILDISQQKCRTKNQIDGS